MNMPEGYDFTLGTNIHVVIPFFIAQDMTFIERTVYDMFDLVRDLGGLVGGLNGFFMVFIGLL